MPTTPEQNLNVLPNWTKNYLYYKKMNYLLPRLGNKDEISYR